MSDFRDPRDPAMPYELDRDAVRRMQAEAYGGAWGLGPLIGLLLLIGVMFIAFAKSDNPQVATNDTPPAATEPATPAPPSGN